MTKLAAQCYAKFKRLAVLNEQQDTGTDVERQAAGKAKRRLNDTWVKRKSNNTVGFWNAKAAKVK